MNDQISGHIFKVNCGLYLFFVLEIEMKLSRALFGQRNVNHNNVILNPVTNILWMCFYLLFYFKCVYVYQLLMYI